MKICDGCRREFPDGYSYCAECGHELRILGFPIAITGRFDAIRYEWD